MGYFRNLTIAGKDYEKLEEIANYAKFIGTEDIRVSITECRNNNGWYLHIRDRSEVTKDVKVKFKKSLEKANRLPDALKLRS